MCVGVGVGGGRLRTRAIFSSIAQMNVLYESYVHVLDI